MSLCLYEINDGIMCNKEQLYGYVYCQSHLHVKRDYYYYCVYYSIGNTENRFIIKSKVYETLEHCSNSAIQNVNDIISQNKDNIIDINSIIYDNYGYKLKVIKNSI